MVTSESLEPDYAVPPGETLAEWLEERRMKQAELASRINISEKALSQIVSGTATLTRATAAKLELVTGIAARTWNNLEAIYQDDRARISQRREFERHSDWVREMPATALRKLGIITATKRDQAALVRQLLEFFGVSDPEAWRRLWLGEQAVALRQSPAFTADPAAVATWLRLGELEAEQIEVAAFSGATLRASLPELRALTRERDPEIFADQMVRIAAECGIAVVFVPEIPGARCSGAARWVHHRPIVQLSLRFGTDDHLWFTFFHELAHILLHGKKDVFISSGATDHHAHGDKEIEADAFARDLLIPRRFDDELQTLLSLNAIRDFADRIGVSAGIVVGRLQHDGIIGFDVGQSLKVRYTLTDSTEK